MNRNSLLLAADTPHNIWSTLNEACFDGKLWPCAIVVSPNVDWDVCVFGACYVAPHNSVSIWLWDELDKDLIHCTIAHEMVHQWQRQNGYPMHHNRQFRSWAKRIKKQTGLDI